MTNHLAQRAGFGGGQLAVKAALPVRDGVRKCLKQLARREGFEPPTPRLEGSVWELERALERQELSFSCSFVPC